MHTFLVDFADLSRLLRTGPGLFLGVLGAYFKHGPESPGSDNAKRVFASIFNTSGST